MGFQEVKFLPSRGWYVVYSSALSQVQLLPDLQDITPN